MDQSTVTERLNHLHTRSLNDHHDRQNSKPMNRSPTPTTIPCIWTAELDRKLLNFHRQLKRDYNFGNLDFRDDESEEEEEDNDDQDEVSEGLVSRGLVGEVQMGDIRSIYEDLQNHDDDIADDMVINSGEAQDEDINMDGPSPSVDIMNVKDDNDVSNSVPFETALQALPVSYTLLPSTRNQTSSISTPQSSTQLSRRDRLSSLSKAIHSVSPLIDKWSPSPCQTSVFGEPSPS